MTYSGLDDTELLRLLQQEDEGAFAAIYDKYWKLLFVTANNIIQSQEAAKDAVQEIFINLWQRKAELNIQNLKAYLQQAARFQVLKAIRNQKNDEQFYKRLAETGSGILYDNPLLFKEQQALIGKVLESLPDDCRQVFRLSREEQMTYKQIAIQLEISEKTVEKKMSICLRHFREAMQRNALITIGLMLSCFPGKELL